MNFLKLQVLLITPALMPLILSTSVPIVALIFLPLLVSEYFEGRDLTKN